MILFYHSNNIISTHNLHIDISTNLVNINNYAYDTL